MSLVVADTSLEHCVYISSLKLIWWMQEEMVAIMGQQLLVMLCFWQSVSPIEQTDSDDDAL